MPAGRMLQRKCACGGSAASGECDECSKQDFTLQRSALDHNVRRHDEDVPPIVNQVLRSTGQPLDVETRGFMEPRLGHDFSRVQVHTDALAEESARSVNALAYTVGSHIVFGRGQYAPRTSQGLELLTHELVHVLQQQGDSQANMSTASLAIGDSADPFEREASEIARTITSEATASTVPTDTPATSELLVQQHTSGPIISRWEACGTAAQCPARESGERERAQAARLQVGTLTGTSTVVISPFAIGSGNASSLNSDPNWAPFLTSIDGQTNRWEILGFTDCEGGAENNTELRQLRARNVHHLLPASARAKVDRFTAAPLSDCVATNGNEAERAVNRSVIFRITSSAVDFPAETVVGVACPPSSTAGVTTLSNYVALLACAERRAGLSSRMMLTLFRQLYYGKPWSSVSTTDRWDNVIRCSPTVGHPQSLLGNNLYHALRNSAEVEGVDVGHVFTGLEAMTCPTQQVEFYAGLAAVEMSNEDFATWGGDLGAAAAATVACPQLGTAAATSEDCGFRTGAQPLSFYLGVHAPAQDLEGDIDSFVMRAERMGLACAGSARRTFTPSRPMSEVFYEYYIDETSALGVARADRYRCFLQAIGANVQGSRITNVSNIRDPIAGRVSSFGEAFWIKIHGGGVATAATQDTGDRINILIHSQHATDWFLRWVTDRL